MAKQLNVKLNFDADTSRAKQQIQDLQNSLNNVINAPTNKLGAGISTNIQAAIKDVTELQIQLNKATNADTGKIDFSKLNQSIAKSGKSLQQYGQQLMSLGPMGQQAFGQLAQAIASSEVPIFRISNKLKELGTTLANTARWQISSSVLHGFMGAVQSAYGYAQDLNESLNNIRIVTGQSVDDMAKFAKEANKAAKALSATTTEYTNASLIYYQQGLSDQQVKERTDVTIKMANVARESAETVSDQMTAVWNNFYDGSKSLEYYADVMTALGAATASSTAEISEGLNKFAAVAETVGLSYEYATAALATVTATTRQSADVVGTAFKTLFARVQDLELGNTLDDGTTLGSYSQALEKVGINIKDTSGNLKDMDVILEEMAMRWEALGKAEQTALAQNVAGVRQYTQLIALMDNWDFMKENLSTASSATGTLQAQADIYAESWESAQDRVRAAAEKIYSSLIDEEFFIDLTNGFEDILTLVGKFIDSIGGIKGVLSTVGVLLTTSVFSDKIAQGISNMALAMQSMTAAGRQKIADQRTQTMENFKAEFQKQQFDSSSATGQAEYENISRTLDLSNLMLQNEEKMSELEKEQNRRLTERLQLLQQEHLVRAKAIDQLKQELEYTQKRLEAKAKAKDQGENYTKFVGNATAINTLTGISTEQDQKDFDVKKAVQRVNSALKIEGVDKKLSLNGNISSLKTFSTELNRVLKELYDAKENAEIALKSANFTEKELDHIPKTLENIDVAQKELDASGKQVGWTFNKMKEDIPKATGAQKDWSTAVVAGANAAFNAAMMVNSLRGAIDTLKNPDISGWEKFTSVLMSFAMIIPGIVNTVKTFKTVLQSETFAKIANTAATIGQVIAEKKLNKVKGEGKSHTHRNIKEIIKDTKEKWNTAAFKKSNRFEQTGSIKNTNIVKDKTTGKYMTENAAKKLAGGEAIKPLKAAGSMALIAAGVALASIAIKAGVEAWQKYDKAAEQATAQAQSAAENYKKLVEDYNTFTSNISSYEEAQKGLTGLTKGTLEYQEALIKANEAAGELLDQYEDLEYTVDENGVIQIDKQSLEKAQAEKLDQRQTAFIAKQQADIYAQQKQAKADQVNLARDKIDSRSGFWASMGNLLAATAAGAGSGALIGAGVGGIAGTVIPGAGNVIGAGSGAAIGAIAGGISGLTTGIAMFESSSQKEQKAMDKLAEAYADNSAAFEDDGLFKRLLQDLEITDPVLINSLIENRDAVKNLSKEVNQNNKQIAALNKQIVSDALRDNKEIMNSIYADEIIASTAKFAQGIIEQGEQALIDEGWGTKGINKADTEKDTDAQNVFKEWAISQGLDPDSVKLTGVTGTDKNRKFVYNDAADEKQVVELAKMITDMAIYNSDKEIREKAEGQLNVAKKLETANKDTAEDAIKLLNGITNGVIDLSAVDYDAANLDTAFVNQLTDDDLKAFGVSRDKVDGLLNRLKEQFNAKLPEWIHDINAEDRELLIKMGVNEDSAKDAAIAALKYAQTIANENTIKIQLELETELLNLLKEGKFDELKGKMMLSQEEGGMGLTSEQWLEFLALDEAEQEDFIKNNGQEIIQNVLSDLNVEQAKEDYEYAMGYDSAKPALIDKQNLYNQNNAILKQQGIDKFQFLKQQGRETSDAVLFNVANSVLNGLQNFGWTTEDAVKHIQSFKESGDLSDAEYNDLLLALADYDPLWVNQDQQKLKQELDLLKEDVENRKNAKFGINGVNAETAYEAALKTEKWAQANWKNQIEQNNLNLDVANAQKELLTTNFSLFEGLDEETQTYRLALEKLTLATLKAERGLDTIYENLPKWKAAIAEGDSEEVIPEIKNALKDTFNLTDAALDKMSPQDLINLQDELTAVWQGEEGAISNLGKQLASNYANDSGYYAIAKIIEQDLNNYKLGDEADKDLIKRLEASLSLNTIDEDTIKTILSSLGFTTHIQDGQILTEYSIDTAGSGANGADDYKNFEPVDIEAEHDEYHQLKEEIEAVQRAYTNAGREKDKVFGKSKLKYIEEEINLLDQELKKTNALTAGMSQDLFSDSGKQVELSNKYGFEFDENGIISNYNDIMKRQEAELKRAEQDYNEAVKAGNGETDSVIQAWEDAQEKYETFVSDTSKYEELLDEYNSLIDKEAEIRDNIISAKLEKIITEIDFEIEISDRDLKKLDYILSKFSKDVNSMIEQIDVMTNQSQHYISQSETAQSGIDRIRAQANSENRELTDAEQRQIWSYEDEILSNTQSIQQIIDQVNNSLLEEFNRLGSEIDDNINRFETYSSALDHYRNIIKLSGRQTKDSALLMQLSANQTDIAMQKLIATQDKYTWQLETQKDVEASLNEAKRTGNEDEIKYWQEQYDEITKAVEESHNAVLGSWEEVLQAASDAFDTNIELTIEKLKSSMSEYGLDGLSDRYEKAQNENERYLSQLDKEYELNKLIREVEKSRDDTDNIAGKQKLNGILSNINSKMAEGVELSQYELDYLRSQYEVELARQALEDAKNAKSTVRLTRDNEGNFGYVYTANQDAIDEATQKYEDAIYKQRKLNEDYIKDLEGRIIQNEKDLAEALANIDKTKFDTREAYEAEVNRITQYYLDQDLYLRQQLDTAVTNSGLIYGNTILAQLESTNSMMEGHDKLKQNTEEAASNMIDSWTNWKTTTETAMRNMGTSTNTFSNDMVGYIGDISNATDDLAANTKTQIDNIELYYDGLLLHIKEWRTKWMAELQLAIEQGEKYLGIYDKIKSIENKGPETTDNPGTEALPPTTEKPETVTIDTTIVPTKGKQYVVKTGETLGELYMKAYGKNYLNADGNGFTQEFWEWCQERGIGNPDKIYGGQVIQFNTGGYTGAWGSEGRWALLDQKELVLNSTDTENILRTVSFVRELASLIDSQASMSNISGFFSSPGIGNHNSTLEQNVEIHAEFPNATDRYEIEEAFNSLVNRASQYANRK